MSQVISYPFSLLSRAGRATPEPSAQDATSMSRSRLDWGAISARFRGGTDDAIMAGMRRLASLGLLVATIGCGGSMLGTPGTAGTSGSGTGGTTGIAGTTGIGGTISVGGTGGGDVGGTGGTLPACGGAGGGSDSVEVAIVGSDGNLIAAAVQAAAVTVTSIDSCTAVTCPESFTGSFPTYLGPHISRDATRIVLAGASAQQWTLYLRNTSMPASLVHVGDAFDLTVAAALTDYSYGVVYQTVVLAHGSDLVLFAHTSAGISGVVMPDLINFQINVTGGAPYCETATVTVPPGGAGGAPGTYCGNRKLAAVVAVAGQSATLRGGETAQVGWLSVTNGVSSDGFGGGCHMISYRAMAGFR